MLEDLRDYGLIYQPNAASTTFSPSRLATTLTSSMPPMPSSGPAPGSGSEAAEASGGGNGSWGSGTSGQGFIVLETNYRLYAYTGQYS